MWCTKSELFYMDATCVDFQGSEAFGQTYANPRFYTKKVAMNGMNGEINWRAVSVDST